MIVERFGKKLSWQSKGSIGSDSVLHDMMAAATQQMNITQVCDALPPIAKLLEKLHDNGLS